MLQQNKQHETIGQGKIVDASQTPGYKKPTLMHSIKAEN